MFRHVTLGKLRVVLVSVLLSTTFLMSPSWARAVPAEFFSEYVEGSSNRKGDSDVIAPDVIITEVFYDVLGSGSDDGWEWVELYNRGDSAVDLSSWSLGNGGSDYTHSLVPLCGEILSGTYYIVGGPYSGEINGGPTYSAEYNFHPDFQNSGSTAGGVALFNVPADQVTPGTVPMDAVIYGQHNDNGLIDETGMAPDPHVVGADDGLSIQMDLAGNWSTGSPDPADLGAELVACVPGGPEVPMRSICEIQGSGWTSEYVGELVRTQGVVYADLDERGKRGFYIQDEDEDCGGHPEPPDTSDGIFVYVGSGAGAVSAGDLVEVRGTVGEYYDATQISASGITVLSRGRDLPAPFDLDPPFDNAESSLYFERLEGMYVKMDDAVVVGPTDSYDESWVVRGDLGLERVFHTDPTGTGVIVGVDDSGLFEIDPEVKVGDRVSGLIGALDYTFGAYKMQLTARPTVDEAPDPPKYGDADGDGDVDLDDKAFIQHHLNSKVPPAPPEADLNGDGRVTGRDVAAFEHLWNELALKPAEFTVATFNLENLFDTVNDPGEDTVLSDEDYARKLDKLAEAIHDELREPTLIGVQEVENAAVLEDLAAQPEIEAAYGVLLVEGPDSRGIDVGLLYQEDRVTVLSGKQRQGCTTRVDGLGPDGNYDVLDPYNEVTCDADGDGELDGNRLFSRPPLVVQLEVQSASGGKGKGRTQELWVIVNHWKSKTNDTPDIQYTLPRRIEQAMFVAGLTQEILASDPGADIIVLGDLNDYMDAQPLKELTDAGLENLLSEVDQAERYTYVYQGVSQVLDHLLISPDLGKEFAGIEVVHINADYPAQWGDVVHTARGSSDHDAVLARFRMGR
ncbi:MAG: lamin tail domain-containing protein [Anaerolineae bacterium]|nr:lamin tail domain-containing protein [Anaerolineae bacterium]